MRIVVFALAATSLFFAATSAQAGASCSTFAKIKTYDNDSQSITIEKEKGSEQKYFPKTEGAPTTSKIPKGCKSRVLSQDSYPVKATGGRLAITQFRENFSGKMLNDVDDPAWLANQITQVIESGEMVLVVLRQPPGGGKDAPYGVTTVYMPITPAEEAEIARLNAQASDD